MNLYYFNPNGYGEEAFVCAESKEKAIEYLQKTLDRPDTRDYDREKVRAMTNLEDDYTLDELPVGEVVFTEIS